MHSLIINLIFYSIGVLFLTSCAQVVSPTGGEKDIAPPQLLLANPPMETTNFRGQEIVLEFDEFIQLRNLKKQLLVSPPLRNDPIVEIRGKKLHITLNDTLKKNTTYLLNFGNSVVDLNEANPFGNLKYVFSTGAVVDSLESIGLVLDAYQLKTESNILVMLYENKEDSIPYKELPNYISRTDEDGEFLITNIKEGHYKVFALDDQNQNYIYDHPDERIAFLDSSITLPAINDSIQLSLFLEEETKKFIKDKKVVDGAYQIVFSTPTDSIVLAPIFNNDLPSHFILKNTKKDSLKIWFHDLSSDKDFEAIVKDLNYIYDTVSIRIPVLKDSVLGLKNKVPNIHNYFSPLTISFNRPINDTDKSKIFLFKNDTIPSDFELKFNKNSSRLLVDAEWEENSPYKIQLLPNAVVGLYGFGNDSISTSFKTNAPNDFSSLSIRINTENTSNKIMELLDVNGKTLQQKSILSGNVKFNNQKPGDYRLKLIFDENGNGKWDTGNYLKKQSPEKAVLFDGIINLRPNWEKELIWELK